MLANIPVTKRKLSMSVKLVDDKQEWLHRAESIISESFSNILLSYNVLSYISSKTFVISKKLMTCIYSRNVYSVHINSLFNRESLISDIVCRLHHSRSMGHCNARAPLSCSCLMQMRVRYLWTPCYQDSTRWLMDSGAIYICIFWSGLRCDAALCFIPKFYFH